MMMQTKHEEAEPGKEIIIMLFFEELKSLLEKLLCVCVYIYIHNSF
jgi:hypothetical protein